MGLAALATLMLVAPASALDEIYETAASTWAG